MGTRCLLSIHGVIITTDPSGAMGLVPFPLTTDPSPLTPPLITQCYWMVVRLPHMTLMKGLLGLLLVSLYILLLASFATSPTTHIDWLTRLSLSKYCNILQASGQTHRPLTAFEGLQRVPHHTLCQIYKEIMSHTRYSPYVYKSVVKGTGWRYIP